MSKIGLDFQALYKQYSKEKHYKQQFERYQTVVKEDLDEFREEHDCDEEHALVALYLADFVVTASNLRGFTTTDSERRNSLLKFCHAGFRQNRELEPLIFLHMLSQELATYLRRSYFYQLDRGMPINIALVRVADTFVMPFLMFVRTVSNSYSLRWLIALVEGAVSEILANDVYDQLEGEEYLIDFKDYRFADATLSSLERFANRRSELPNPEATVPLLVDSAGALLIRNLSNNEEHFGNSTSMTGKQLVGFQKEFFEVCARSKFRKQNVEPVYYRATGLASSTEKIGFQTFLVRGSAPDSGYEAWFFLNTTADDINLALIRRRLEDRCRDIEGLIRRPMAPKKAKKKKVKPIQVKPIETEPVKKLKPSLIQRIIAFFKRKPAMDESMDVEPEKPVTEREVIEHVEPELVFEGWSRDEVLNTWAQALVVDAVAGIDLEEAFDVLREKEFIITGLADFPNLPNPEGTLLTIKGKNKALQGILTSLGPHLAELRDVATHLLPTSAREGLPRFVPEEVFLEQKADIHIYDLLTFAVTDKALTVIIAENTYHSNPIYFAPSKATTKRRTLQRFARQLVSAKTSFPIEDRMGSVLESLIDTTQLKSQPISAQLIQDYLTHEDFKHRK